MSLQIIKSLFDWRVAVDLLLIATVIFFLYHTLRASGSWKIVAGVGIAGMLFMIARLLNLQGIEWIYANLSPVLLLALIVIFHPEIRKIFERAASIAPKEEIREATRLAYLLSDAIFSLAKQKRGALIVLPAKESIQARVSEGINLDAVVSFPILMSIFDPHSPGHDGAVIIENGRLAKFGVRLPLSQSGSLSENFGTRHHAALGLTEITDAMVIAVSEERGTVSVFQQGELLKIEDQNQLAAKVLAHIERSSSYELPGLRTTNRKALATEMAISLLLAFLFWALIIYPK